MLKTLLCNAVGNVRMYIYKGELELRRHLILHCQCSCPLSWETPVGSRGRGTSRFCKKHTFDNTEDVLGRHGVSNYRLKNL